MQAFRSAGLIAGVVLLATPAAAAPPLTLPPPTAAQIAAARAEGDALLRAAHAQDLFINESDRGAIVLRHMASGFRCVLNPGKPQNRVTVFRSLNVGDDVGCTTATVLAAQELFFTRAPERTAERALAEDVKIIKATDPGSEVYAPPPTRSILGLPPGVSVPTPVTASLRGGKQGGHRIVVGKAGDWLVDYRFQGAPFLGDLGSILDSSWTTTVLEGRRHSAQAGGGAGGSAAASAVAAAASVTPAEARAEGDAIIARATAGDVFQNVTVGKAIELRHTPSGFVCTFDAGSAENGIIVYPRQPRGIDVACNTRMEGALSSRYVTKFPVTLTLDQATAVYVREIKTAHPDAKLAPGSFADATSNKPGAPPSVPRRTVRLAYTMNGETAFSRLSVAVINGWVIEQRVTAPIKDAFQADFGAEILMLGDVDRMSGRLPPAAPPLPAPPTV